jgi:hypothetical protein
MNVGYKELDEVLLFIRDNKTDNNINEIYQFSNAKFGNYTGGAMISKLQIDKYIEVGGSNSYKITFTGNLLLNEEGGYSGKSKKEKDLAELNQKLLIQNRNFTKIIAFATALSTLFSCITLYKTFNQQPIKIQIEK